MKSSRIILGNMALLWAAVLTPSFISTLEGQELDQLLSRPGSNIPDLSERFDADKNGVLNKKERTAARTFLHEEAINSVLKSFEEKDENKDGKLNRNEIGGGFRNPFRRADRNQDGYVDRSEATGGVFRDKVPTDHPDGQALSPHNFRNTGSGLYDMSAFRTLFLEFEDDDWLSEMHDFYHTEIEVPANLIVDSHLIRGVGVRYRGNSSFFLMSPDKKRSLNLSIDHTDNKENLYGYETLNLHNGAEDPTFLREVLYLRICRDYMPALNANWTKVVINGQYWGVYLNVQQYNADFTEDWFGSRKGVRWKAPAGFGGTKGLSYEGDDKEAYAGYELKTQDDPDQAWNDLTHLCRTLSTTPDDELEAKLKPLFNIDGALWSLALENVFVDEGYVVRKSDYSFYQDKSGRFHLLQHDANEVFNEPHGPGLPRDFVATKLEPLHNIDNPQYAVIHRLLKIPHLRARYLAHMRTIMEDWLNWDRLEPLVLAYHSMIADAVHNDVRKLYSTEDFEKGIFNSVAGGRVSSIKDFVEQRRTFLLDHELFKKSGPKISSVRANESSSTENLINVTAKISDARGANWVGLHWASKRNEPYTLIRMHDDGQHGDGKANDGLFGATLSKQKPGTRFHYYIEARTGQNGDLISSFYPPQTESGALTKIVK